MNVELTRVLVVLGMHRSGTSVVTRALEVLGVALGDNLMPPAENNNEKGFFEDLDIHRFNTRLLAALGTAWDRLDEIDADRFEDPAMDTWLQEALAILRKKLPAVGAFAFKDPQTCRLLPFWQRVLASLPVDVHYVICLRNPLSVADSLSRRDKIDKTRAQLLWAKHLLTALSHTKGKSRLLVDYDRMMDSPTQQLNRIANGFGMSVPKELAQRQVKFEREFLCEELRHARHDSSLLGERDQVLRPVEELYILMSEIANGQIGDAVEAEFARISAELNEIRSLTQQ